MKVYRKPIPLPRLSHLIDLVNQTFRKWAPPQLILSCRLIRFRLNIRALSRFLRLLSNFLLSWRRGAFISAINNLGNISKNSLNALITFFAALPKLIWLLCYGNICFLTKITSRFLPRHSRQKGSIPSYNQFSVFEVTVLVVGKLT